MTENHISEILIDLYAAGYRFLPERSVRKATAHLRSCDMCARRFMNRCREIDQKSIRAWRKGSSPHIRRDEQE